jgi:hypothetical protein
LAFFCFWRFARLDVTNLYIIIYNVTSTAYSTTG